MPRFYGFIIQKDTNFILLETKQEVQEFFAPIESVEEALSYAILVTGDYPRYEFAIPIYFKKYV